VSLCFNFWSQSEKEPSGSGAFVDRLSRRGTELSRAATVVSSGLARRDATRFENRVVLVELLPAIPRPPRPTVSVCLRALNSCCRDRTQRKCLSDFGSTSDRLRDVVGGEPVMSLFACARAADQVERPLPLGLGTRIQNPVGLRPVAGQDSNLRHMDYESIALPIELPLPFRPLTATGDAVRSESVTRNTRDGNVELTSSRAPPVGRHLSLLTKHFEKTSEGVEPISCRFAGDRPAVGPRRRRTSSACDKQSNC